MGLVPLKMQIVVIVMFLHERNHKKISTFLFIDEKNNMVSGYCKRALSSSSDSITFDFKTEFSTLT